MVRPLYQGEPNVLGGRELPESSYEVVPAEVRSVGTFRGQDEEGQSLSWSLGGVDAGKFRFETKPNPNEIEVFFRDPPDYENPTDLHEVNQYHFTVRASDGSNTGAWDFLVLIYDINEPPTIRADTVPDYMEIEWDFTGTPPPVHTFTATDPEGDAIQWIMGTAEDYPEITGIVVANHDGEAFTMGRMTGVMTFNPSTVAHTARGFPNFEAPRDYGADNVWDVVVRATDGEAKRLTGLFTQIYVQVRVINVNEKPGFLGDPATAISQDENELASEILADYDARDEEGDITWSLTGADRGDFSIDSDGVVTFNSSPNFEDAKDSGQDNVYNISVVATDVMSGSSRRRASVDVTVTLNDLEEDGVITVSNVNPGVGESVRFELSDPDGGIQVGATNGFLWTVQGRTSDTSPWQEISSSNTGQLFFVFTAQEEHTGQQVRAVVNAYEDRRGTGKSAESEPTAAVTRDPIANAPPRLRTPAAYAIAEGAAGASARARRRLGQPLHVTDRDGDTLTFAIAPGANSGLFAVDASTGQLWAVQDLDFETLPSPSLGVTVHDGKGVDTDNNEIADSTVDITIDVTVTVTDVEEPGSVTLSAKEPAIGVRLQATLEDGDGNISDEAWQWARSEDGRTNWFSIAEVTSSDYTPTEDDTDFYLRARVRYTDNRGSGKSAGAVTTASVPSRNRRPAFPSTEDGARAVDENSRAGANIGAPVAAVDPEDDRLTYTLTGDDAGAFAVVTSSGQIRVKEALDFETKDSYSLTVNVHDGLDGEGDASTTTDDTQDVTITVLDLEERGTVTLSTLTGIIQSQVEVTATLSDPDGGVSDLTWQWSQSPSGRTDWANIAGADTDRFTPPDGLLGRYIRATASYSDGNGPDKTARGVSLRRVADPPPVNSAPVFPPTETGQRELPENASGGDTIGAPVAATDLNEGDAAVNDPLAYSLTGTDADSFTIDASTGQLALAQNVTLDYETKRSYRVTVEVTDGYDRLGDDEDPDVIDARLNVTIDVTDVNEAPTVEGEAAVTVEENSNRAIATYTGTDPEGAKLTWSVNNQDFWISDRGELHFASPPSFEDRDTHPVTVSAADPGGLESNALSVTVTVTDLEEEGTVTVTPLRGWEDTFFRATLADGDGGLSGDSWQWARSSNRSTWTDIPTAISSNYTAGADDVGQYLRASAEYTDGRDSGKTAEAVLTVRVADAADRPATNSPPAFADTTATRSVGQGTAAGRSVGGAVRATDADRDDVLTYSLTGTDAEKFAIDPATGQLRTKAVLAHDPEGTNTYMVTVTVHDGFDDTYGPNSVVDDTIEVTITVTAVSRRTPVGVTGGGGFGPALSAPKFADGFRTTRPLALNAKVGDAVGDVVAATHPDDLDVTYSLSGTDATLFTVDEETGQIRLGAGVSLELGQTYTVNLTATDSTGTGAIIIVDIEVAEPDTHPYDLNGNGTFEKDEVIKAVSDYFAGLIEKAEVLEIVSRYFAE